MAIRTIFSMAQDCARGERLGWQEFVRDYAGIARALLTHYFSTLEPEMDEHVIAVFRRAAAHSGSWFAGLKFSNEREFMMAFHDLVLAYGREQERVPAPPITLDQMRAIVKDLNLLERELLWLIIKGYDGARVAAIMMNAAATADAVERIAGERLAPHRANNGRAEDPALMALACGAPPGHPVVSLQVLMELAEQAKTDKCAPLKTFNNLVNGQITWRERELAEEHMSNCFYCIDRFTTFQEMVRFRKDVPPLPEPQVEAILARLPFAAGKPRSALSRWFAGR
jgi:AcrR family transcriptional regulator